MFDKLNKRTCGASHLFLFLFNLGERSNIFHLAQEEKGLLWWIVSLPHMNTEIFKEVIMGILSPTSDIPLVQLFLLSAMISTWGAFSPPTSSGNHNSLLYEGTEEEKNRTNLHYLYSPSQSSYIIFIFFKKQTSISKIPSFTAKLRLWPNKMWSAEGN